MDLRYIELFAGIGGLGEGFRREGARCVYANEIDKYAAQTYLANNELPSVDLRDVRELTASDIPNHEILLAGFPCQPFSIAGVSKRRTLGVPTGSSCKKQGDLIWYVLRLIKAKRPQVVVLENVKNLISIEGGRILDEILNTLADLNYSTSYRILDAACWVPQHRERVFIVALRGRYTCDLTNIETPKRNSWPTLSTVLHANDGFENEELPYTFDAPGLKVSNKYMLSDRLWAYLKQYKQKHRKMGNGFGFSLVGPQDQARTLSSRYYKDGAEILISRRNKNPRRLTPRECSRLMGFDEGRTSKFQIPVSDNQAYRQFGNSVVVPVSNVVAQAVISCT